MDKNKNHSHKEDEDSLVHDLEIIESSMFSQKLIISLLIASVLGIGTGYIISIQNSNMISVGSKNISVVESEKYKIVDSEISKTFKDTAEGMLKDGGIDNEGQYHLVRPGGESQNVYLTSSLVDLSKFLGKKVKVWGQTNSSKKAGWLMEVGQVESL
ncbi:MAG: hypothetical protein EXS44_00185 [Candidatus Levybacteria bacterium]|nr:hypothetical protein [Candidatus Levybacteria bacterium]